MSVCHSTGISVCHSTGEDGDDWASDGDVEIEMEVEQGSEGACPRPHAITSLLVCCKSEGIACAPSLGHLSC